MRRLLTTSASSERAFESLYERHVRDIYRYTYAVLGNAMDAEDVTQATFLNAYRSIERGGVPVSLSIGWGDRSQPVSPAVPPSRPPSTGGGA